MRCPDCNRFVSFDEQEPELNVSLDADEIYGECRVVLPCADCGTELKEYNFEVAINVGDEHVCPVEEPEGGWPEDEEQFELLSESADFATDVQREYYDKKAKKMKPIKNSRYAKTYYGAHLEFEVRCRRCDESFTVTEDLSESASSFDELV